MNETSEVFNQAREALALVMPVGLPTSTRALTLEVTSWLATVRIYCHGPIADLDRDAIEAKFRLLVADLPPRPDEPWQLTVEIIRQDEPRQLDVFGTPVWVRPGTRLATVDLKSM